MTIVKNYKNYGCDNDPFFSSINNHCRSFRQSVEAMFPWFVTVFHPKRTLPAGTIKNKLKQAGLQ